MKTLFNKLWQYNDWANKSLIDSMSQQEVLLSGKSLQLLSHIMNAQLIWIERIKGIKPKLGVWDEHDLNTCRRLHQLASGQIKEEIENRESDWQEIIRYCNSLGQHFETQLDDILIHVFNHGTYHRAQIAQDLRINELAPIGTDYIVFARKN